MLCLYLKAPFAAFRTFTAGSYRPTAPFLTPSAAYGLVLNIAGIESRLDDGVSLVTVIRSGLPQVNLALGALRFPEVQSVYQQLHNYPVGSTGKDRATDCYGSKYNIQPIRREFLIGLEAYVCLDGNPALEDQVRQGLRAGGGWCADGHLRYGIPFLGDNNFMIDVLHEEPERRPAHWYEELTPGSENGAGRVCRLTVWINRSDMSRTLSRLYAPTETPCAEIPPRAWTRIEPFSEQAVRERASNSRRI